MKYLIWSFEHNAWWKPNEMGYTENIVLAGRYSPLDAGRIVTASILLDEVAVLEQIAESKGPPSYHPYGGEEGRLW